MTPSGGGAVALKYDPYGRLYEVAGAATTRFVYDGDAMIQELDGANALLRRYVHGNGVDEPLVWYEGAGLADADRKHFARDRQGSIVAVAESATTAPDINAYTPFGVPDTSNTGRFSYTGQMVVPEIDLLYYKARIYSPQLGRFLQTDPIGYDDQQNLYAYVHNDPMNATDPTGMESCRECRHMKPIGPTPRADAIISTAIDFTPILGTVKGMVELANEPSPMTAIGVVPGGKYLTAPKATENLVDVFRAVDDTELDAINRAGKFELGPNGGEVKSFVDNPGDARALAETYSAKRGENFTVVQGQVPQSTFDNAERFDFTDVPGRPMEGVSLRGQEQVDQVCYTGTCK